MAGRFCPMNVRSPLRPLAGVLKPLGKGFESVVNGVRPPSMVLTKSVKALKLSAPVLPELGPKPVVIPYIKPKPDRITRVGSALYANPTRGAKLLLSASLFPRGAPLRPAKTRPPLRGATPGTFKGSGALKSNQEVRSFRSVRGRSESQRRPRSITRRELRRQVSWA